MVNGTVVGASGVDGVVEAELALVFVTVEEVDIAVLGGSAGQQPYGAPVVIWAGNDPIPMPMPTPDSYTDG
jgi:hypothetical protein